MSFAHGRGVVKGRWTLPRGRLKPRERLWRVAKGHGPRFHPTVYAQKGMDHEQDVAISMGFSCLVCCGRSVSGSFVRYSLLNNHQKSWQHPYKGALCPTCED